MNLKNIMDKQGISRMELVEVSGVPLPTLEHYLYKGRAITSMKICTLLKVCKGLNMTLEQFFTETDILVGGYKNE